MSEELILICDYPGVIDRELLDLLTNPERKFRLHNSLELFELAAFPMENTYLAGVYNLAEKYVNQKIQLIHVKRDLHDFVGRHLTYLWESKNPMRPRWVESFQSFLVWVFSDQQRYLSSLCRIWQKRNRESILDIAIKLNYASFNSNPSGQIRVLDQVVTKPSWYCLDESQTHQLIGLC